jgi:hypothetical protein
LGCARPHGRGSVDAYAGAVYEAVLVVLGTGFIAFGAFIAWGLRCDESCVENRLPSWDADPAQWWETQDAWQWSAQLGLAVVGFGVICLAFAWVWVRHYRRAYVAMTLGAAFFGAWSTFDVF